MRPLSRSLEQIFYGALVGLFLGMIAGNSEYFLFLHRSFSGDLGTAYWQIIVPYAMTGFLCGALASLAAALFFREGPSFGYRMARIFALFIGLAFLSHALAWTITYFGPPLLKPTHIVAYMACAFAAATIGLLVHWGSQAIFLRLEEAAQRARRSLKLWTAVGLSGVSALMFLPGIYVPRSQALSEKMASSPIVDRDARRPNIVFILVDTLRADHLPIYGYSRQTAPYLTAFARRSAIFNRMYAQASWTSPSVASIFTSLYPPFHTVDERLDFLPNSATALSEILKGAGYRTFAISANFNVSPTFGFSQGFDEFWVAKPRSALHLTTLGAVAGEVIGPRTLKKILRETREIVPRADAITDIALQFASRRRRQPFFAYVHYIDPHFPYRPPSPYDRAFDYRSDPPLRAGGVDPLKLASTAQELGRVAEILDQYDGEILYTDQAIGRLLTGLEEMGALEDTLVIITADHGEEFFEHGKLGHRETLYEEVLRVPFLISWPGRIPAGTTYNDMTGLIDVMPTLLELLGMKSLPGFQGSSFASQLTAPARGKPARTLFAQLTRISFSLEMALDGRHKLIRHVGGPTEGAEEFYDLERDPLERTKIVAGAQPRLGALKTELEALNRLVAEQPDGIRDQGLRPVDADTKKALRSLGYVN